MTPFSHNELAALLNLYMSRYIDNPEEFGREFEAIIEFLNDEEHNRVPNYGKDVVAYLEQLRNEEA